MFATFLQGFMLSAAMILPLGAQNMFVLSQGIQRQYHLMVASLCALSDMLLICAGVFGGSALLSHSLILLKLVTLGGAAFLFWYGWSAFKTAWSVQEETEATAINRHSRKRIIVTMLAVTWLNPHVYLDTFVVLGSVGGQLSSYERPWFSLGAIGASILWFFSLASLAAWLAPWLRRPKAQRIINLFVGVVMWVIAVQLLLQLR